MIDLVKSEMFGDIQCDFYQNEYGEVFMTSEQIGTALGYSDPHRGINKLTNRNPHLKEMEFSSVVKLTTKAGRRKKTRLFNEDGIYEVAFLANTIKAHQFKTWVRSILKALRKGFLELKIARAASKEVRKELADIINEKNLNVLMHNHAYDNYTNLVYKAALGMSKREYMRENGIEGNIREHLNAEQLRSVMAMEQLLISLLNLDFSYEAAKDIMLSKANLTDKKTA